MSLFGKVESYKDYKEIVEGFGLPPLGHDDFPPIGEPFDEKKWLAAVKREKRKQPRRKR